MREEGIDGRFRFVSGEETRRRAVIFAEVRKATSALMTRAFGGRLTSHRQSWLGWLVQPEVLGEPLGDAIGTARAGSRSNSPK